MKPNHIYIEAGANNGVFQSRSIHLKEDPQYFGILIEPSKEVFDECVINRKNERTLIYNAALVSKEYKEPTIELQIHSMYHLMNSINKSINQSYNNSTRVPARTLQSILDENDIKEVEYLYLDVEGYENEVLNGIDFNKTKFKNLEIECHAEFIGMTQEDEIKMHTEHLGKYSYTLNGKITDSGSLKLIFN